MNIFVLDENPVKAAQFCCDKHIVKMPTETAQMLCYVAARHNASQDWSTFPRRKENGEADPYKVTGSHRKHACTLWAGSTYDNWQWLVTHGIALCEEYTFRYGKRHGAEDIIHWCVSHAARPIFGDLLPFAQCMPDDYRVSDDAVRAYRTYYLNDKVSFARWREPRKPPEWWIHGLDLR